MKYLIAFMGLALFSQIVFANDDHAAYFKALKDIQQLPKGAVAAEPVTDGARDAILQILNVKAADATIYRGDFDQDGVTEYAVITKSGSMGAQTVNVYQFEDNILLGKEFSKAVVQSLFPKKDMSHFYLFVATPFAYSQNGKTYLRFMNVASDYDKDALRLCTYKWVKDKFFLTGPNLKVDPTTDQLVSADDCLKQQG